jgi:osmotically-inducible protein OsmY
VNIMTQQHRKISVTAIAAALACGLSLAGCSPAGMAVGAGATVGVAAAQEGGIKGAATDASIRVQIANAWFQHDVEMYRRLGMTVREGRVLVTGTVPTPDDRVEAIRLVWQINGVQQVINEIRVDPQGATVGSYVQDSWITSNIKALMMFDQQVQAINYSVETVGGTVYIMGIAQDQNEIDRVINHARNTKYVKNVVSYVRMRGEQVQGLAQQTAAPAPSSSQAQPAQQAPAVPDVQPVPLTPPPVTEVR